MKRTTLFFIIAGVVVLFYIAIVVLFLSPFSPQSTSPSPIPTITTNPSSTEDVRKITPTDTEQKLLQTIENRTELSEKDAIKRAALVAKLQGDSGVLVTTDSFVVSYLKTPDVFQVEILSTDVDAARLASLSWFLDQGLSQEAICTLPVAYFPSAPVLSSLKQQNKKFSVVAPGC